MTLPQKILLQTAILAVALSGAAYGLFKYFGEALATRLPALFPPVDAAFSAIHHPLEPWALDLHVLAAPILVFAFGWIYKDHVLGKAASPGVPAKRSGLSASLLFFLMLASGYWLSTITSEALHKPVVIAHVGAGLLFVGAYGVHLALAPKRESMNGNGKRKDAETGIGGGRRAR